MTTITNHFDRFIQILEEVGDTYRIQEEIEDEFTKIIDDVLASVIFLSPEGTDDPSDITQYRRDQEARPSIRQHGTTLADAFDPTPDIENLPSGIRGTLNIDHPTYDEYDYGIFEILTEGAEGHDISGNPYLVFWWGEPLRWAPTRAPANEVQPPAFWLPVVDHPGVQGFDWTKDAMEQGDEEFQVLNELIGPLATQPFVDEGYLKREQ